MTFRAIFDEAAGRLDAVEPAVEPDGGLTWSRAGRVFAALSHDGMVAEFLLDPAVAAAAARTPDTTPSGRGGGWIRFSPTALDDHAIDRADAWFESAHRRLG